MLQRDVDSAQKAFEAVAARLNQSTLESQATATNVSVLTPAVQSNQPSSPKVLLNTLFSIVIGIALAVVAAFFMEWLDRRVAAARRHHRARPADARRDAGRRRAACKAAMRAAR